MVKYILIAVVLIVVVTLIFSFVKKSGTTDNQTNTTTKPTEEGKIEISASGFVMWMSNLFGKDEETSPVMVTDEEIDELLN